MTTNDLPPGYWFQRNPYLQQGEDCMGGAYSQWTQSAKTPRDSIIIACAGTEAGVTKKLIQSCWEDHDFQNLPDQERFENILEEAKKRGRFFDHELIDVITILGKNRR